MNPSGISFPDTPHCALFQRTVELVGKRWTAAILRTLLAGCSRFGEIIDAIPGLSHRLLSERLDELEKAGLVISGKGARPLYTLTEQGRDLQFALAALEAWNRRWVRD